MKRAIVHIGNLKTGTTAIQAVLRVLRPDLAARGVVMPGLKPTEPAHYAIGFEYERPADKAPRLAAILADIDAAPEDATILITAETLMYVPAAWIKQTLAAHGVGEVTVICYMRPHVSMMGSFYLQNLKNGIIRGPVSAHVGMVGNAPMHFLAVAADHLAVFGRDRVILREFHRSVLNDGSVINDFWDMAGLPADLRGRAIEIEQISNPTPSAEVALLLRAAANHMYDTATPQERLDLEYDANGTSPFRKANEMLFRVLSQAEASLGGSKFRLPVWLQEALETRFAAERARFAEANFRQPASRSWLAEPVEPPEPLRDLPAKPVRDAITEAARRLRKAGQPRAARGLEDFATLLPFATTDGTEVLRSSSLDEVYGLAPDTPPPQPKLARLMTPPKDRPTPGSRQPETGRERHHGHPRQ